MPSISPARSLNQVLTTLLDGGAHLLLCRPDKSPLERSGWQKPGRGRSLAQALRHMESGGLLGLIPNSVGRLVLDMDAGDPRALVAAHPPAAEIPTRRPGGLHLVYDLPGRPEMRRPGHWFGHGAYGQTRCEDAYVILWAPDAVADALQLPHGAHPAPECLLLGPPATDEAVALGLIDPPKRKAGADAGKGPKRPRTTGPARTRRDSGANGALFDLVRTWAYPKVGTARATGDRAAWMDATIRQAEATNADFVDPLGLGDVAAIGYSVALWTWERYTGTGGANVYATHDSDTQRRRALRLHYGDGGDRALRWHERRNAAICADAAAGMSPDHLAEKYRLHRTTVWRILQA